MGDEEIGQTLFLLVIPQQVHHLGLNGYIQGGNGLVADDQLRLEHQCPGNAHPLALSAGKLMGIASRMFPGQTYPLQNGVDIIIGLFSGFYNMVGNQRLRDDVPDCHSRIQRGVGVLEDHLHLFPAGLQLLLGHASDILAVQ